VAVARHGDAIAALLARGEDQSAVRAALARRFPDAPAEQREALLRRVEDSFRSPAS
jgi:lauroyl/myristoyl acyltransferase